MAVIKTVLFYQRRSNLSTSVTTVTVIKTITYRPVVGMWPIVCYGCNIHPWCSCGRLDHPRWTGSCSTWTESTRRRSLCGKKHKNTCRNVLRVVRVLFLNFHNVAMSNTLKMVYVLRML